MIKSSSLNRPQFVLGEFKQNLPNSAILIDCYTASQSDENVEFGVIATKRMFSTQKLNLFSSSSGRARLVPVSVCKTTNNNSLHIGTELIYRRFFRHNRRIKKFRTLPPYAGLLKDGRIF